MAPGAHTAHVPGLRAGGVAHALLAVVGIGLGLLLAGRAGLVSGAADRWLHDGLLAAAAALIALRALVEPEERAAWTALAAGVVLFTLGDVWYLFVLAGDPSPPQPSPADAGWLGFYPCAFVSLALLARRGVRPLAVSLALDSVITSCSLAALVAALVFPAVLVTAAGPPAEVAFVLGYPVAGLVLAALSVSVLGLSAWRPDRRLGLLTAGFLLFALGDSYYALEVARGSYLPGGLLDMTWPAAAGLLALAAWLPARSSVGRIGLRALAIPALCACLALVLLVVGGVHPVGIVAVVLAATSLLAVIVRLALVLRESLAALSLSRQQATTDELTGLPNRARLLVDLASRLEDASSPPWALVLFDLNGFKGYNDRFGHPAGDALLARLGRRLACASDGEASVYRLGGDEFCLIAAQDARLEARVEAAAEALSETGEGFRITTAHGLARSEGVMDPEQAIREADALMYAHKFARRDAVTTQTRDVLMQALAERTGELEQHSSVVGELARRACRALGLDVETSDETVRAAELHDVGKVAVPDAVLNKPGPLSPTEWRLMREHTVVGERILSASAALRPVARLVRASHERWDGTGYPDGLRGEAIPVGARVIAVCDAYNAMTSDRPYAPARPPEDALEELERCAGQQFDARAVAALRAVLGAAPARAGAPAEPAAAVEPA